MKTIKYIFPLLIVGCAYGAPIVDEPAKLGKTCYTPNAMYEITFKQISGDCGEDNSVNYNWVDSEGHIDVPSNCVDHSSYEACETYPNEVCHTWLYEEQLAGKLDWSVDGSVGIGVYSFTAFTLQTGELYCSSEYDVKYVRQWVGAN